MPRPIPLLEFIPALSPRWQSPRHLALIADAFERSERGPVQVFATTPPRHGKTELEKHAIARRLLIDPTCRIGFASYSARYAEKRSRETRRLYERAGGRLAKDANRVSDWRTGRDEGGVWCGGAGGAWTGEGFNLIVVDDPIKGRANAESGVEREKLWEWYTDDLFTRLEPGGSVIVTHTRWTIDDLGGRLLATGEYENIHLPAVDAEGRALWPERFDITHLNRIKAGQTEYTWSSLYMGRPFARGGRLFTDVTFYEALPERLRVVIGIDLAYSSKSQADFSTAVVLGFDDATGDDQPVVYVLDVLRVQVQAPAFVARLKALQAEHGMADLVWYFAGPEKGLVDVMKGLGMEVDARPATIDKFQRAQPVAAAWNAGRVRLPKKAPWLDDFVNECVAFTGVTDLHDDQVDGLAAGFDAGQQPNWVHAMEKMRRQRDAEAKVAAETPLERRMKQGRVL